MFLRLSIPHRDEAVPGLHTQYLYPSICHGRLCHPTRRRHPRILPRRKLSKSVRESIGAYIGFRYTWVFISEFQSLLQPLRTDGGAGGYATLTGSGPIGQFFFYQGSLTAAPRPSSTVNQRPLIGSVLGSTGCSTYGSLGFTEGSSSNKCARYTTFSIQSNQENSQLGAKLAFNSVGGFYACGSGQDVSCLFSFRRRVCGGVC